MLHHGHWPLLTHPGAAVAFKVGDASASVVAGAEAVAVAPSLRAVGLTDMAGTTGDVYSTDVGESPEPPATAWVDGPAERHTTKAAPKASPPIRPPIALKRNTFMQTPP